MVAALLNQLHAGEVLLIINDGANFTPSRQGQKSKQKLENFKKRLECIALDMMKRGIFIIYQSKNPFIRDSNCTPDNAKP